MPGKTRSRRGTGHLYQKDDRWYGQWYVRGKRVKRSLGPVRQPGWWHAKRGEVRLVEIDLQVGGKWRYVMVTDEGTEVGFHGEYREIVPSERLVATEVFEGLPEMVSEEDAATVNTAAFTEAGGRTTLTILIQAKNKISRDAIIQSGMEDGLQDALELLEQTALSLR